MVKTTCRDCMGRGYVLTGIPGPIEFVLGLMGHPTGKAWTRCPACGGKGYWLKEWRDRPRWHR